MAYTGAPEIKTQKRVIALLQKQLGYRYLGNWEYRQNRPVEEDMVRAWLRDRGHSDAQINRALHKLKGAAGLGQGRDLYYANKDVYRLLRYGVKVSPGPSEPHETVWLIDWKHPEHNDFAVAEEVTVIGRHKKRPDLVIYVNGIALAVLELKRSTVSVSEGIRQNLGNQQPEFIRHFFTTIQMIMAGNDTEGLRYAVIDTPEKYWLEWREENPDWRPHHPPEQKYLPKDRCPGGDNALDCALLRLLAPQRFLELIHDFIVFDGGVKKIARHNQYFAVKAAQERIRRREGGIIWHTQGSGKSLTMVWLAKWVREHAPNSRVLIVTDRVELDEQIEGVFKGVDEHIYRAKSGDDLIARLNKPEEWLMCSLIHKFGRGEEVSDRARDRALDAYIAEIRRSLPDDFRPKGQFFVFVDEAHRTQSGKLHQAMKTILPNAMLIGFTGTPLLKKDKRTTVEVFGPYIHTYKYDEAVIDGVVLDLVYEARDIDQRLTSPDRVDRWFEAKTRGLTEVAKARLKQRWGRMQEVLSAQSRLEKIVADILFDMETRPRLMDDRGNALLVTSSIYQACKFYELFNRTPLKGKCAIVTSYRPQPSDIVLEETGEGLTEKLRQYDIYRQMLGDFFDQAPEQAMYRVDEFEQKVKELFIHEPGRMKLLIVVDKLLTGFDAPPATYLYIDKPMRDHGLFQAICRVNRLHTEDKEYGFIIDYRDLFQSLQAAVEDYTGGAFEGFDKEDVEGLLTNRLTQGRERLDEALEQVRAICEPVPPPRDTAAYLHYFVAEDTGDREAIRRNEQRRVALYKAVRRLVRAYANLANEMEAAGYTPDQAERIHQEVRHYETIRKEVELASGDYVDMKQYEPAMRHLLDAYIQADESQVIAQFEDQGLVDLFIHGGLASLTPKLPPGLQQPEAMTEAIENNIRRVIVDEQPVNPKYYEKMSRLLDELIAQRKEEALAYQEYMKRLQALARQVKHPETSGQYPSELETPAQRALYDNVGRDASLALKLDAAIQIAREDGWRGNIFKERQIKRAIAQVLRQQGIPDSVLAETRPEYRTDQQKVLLHAVNRIFDIVVEQHGY